MRVDLSKTFRFESAHLLPMVPQGHKCRRLHGHSFLCDVVVRGEVDEAAGWLVDYGLIKAAAKPLFDQLDHHYLNEIDGLENPTAEVLCRWIWQRLAPALPLLFAITVHETCTTACTYYGPDSD
mgnify:CR=1 FL=1